MQTQQLLSRFIALVKMLASVLLLMTISRLFFYTYNYNSFIGISWLDVIWAFLLGLRFDLSIMLLLNSILIFVAIIPSPARVLAYIFKSKFYKILFLGLNGVLLFVNLADTCYFPIKGRRTDLSILGIWQDILQQAFQLSIHYWYVWVLFIVLMLLLHRFYEKIINREYQVSINFFVYIILFLVSIFATIVGIRGGMQLKPIRPNMAFAISPNVLGNLVLNTPFLMLHNSQLPTLQSIHYFETDQVCLSKFVEKEGKSAAYKPSLIGKPNLVLIVLESFSSEYTSFANPWKGYTPFLDSISAHSLFFANHLSNGRTSIEALPSLLAGIPSMMRESYITSSFQSNTIVGVADILNQKGYQTAFYHGGRNGTMGFDVFTKNAGFKNYYGLNEYPFKEKHFDGNWGVYDAPYLQYFSEQLNQMQQPFFAGIFTLSSHQPYALPDSLLDVFTEEQLPILKTIKYSDWALKNFFAKASQYDWFDNTIFIITADHVQEKIQPWNTFNDFHVPFLMYAPKLVKPYLVDDKITQHLDLPATILDMLHISGREKYVFGHTMFDQDFEGRAILYDYNSDKSLMLGRHYTCLLNTDGSSAWMKTKGDIDTTILEPSEFQKKKITESLKAVYQFHNNGLINNTWFRLDRSSETR